MVLSPAPSSPTASADGTLTYSGFGSQLAGDGRIKRVEVCLTVRATFDDTYEAAISWDGGTTFSSSLRATPQSTVDPQSEILDFSAATLWTPDKIGNANLRVRLTPKRTGLIDTVPPTVDKLFFRAHLLGAPAAVTAANFNKKADAAIGLDLLDLAVTDVTGAFTVLLQDESGAFPPNRNGNGHYALTGEGTIPRAIAAGEYTGDDNLDLVVAHSRGKSIQLFINNGSSGFSAGPLIETGLAPSALIAADFDKDGRTDIASANFGDDAVVIHFGTGDAAAPFRASVVGKSGDGPIAMTAGDFNGDGRIDLAVTNRLSASVTVLLNLPP